MQIQEQKTFKKRISQGDQNSQFTRCHESRVIYSLTNPNARHDSKITKETAIQYFHRFKAYQSIVPNKSYGQAFQSSKINSPQASQLNHWQCRPVGLGEVNKLHASKPVNVSAFDSKKYNISTAINTSVVGAGIKSCVVDRKIPIALHNRFQMLDMLSDMHKACDKVECQHVLLRNTDNVHDTSSEFQGHLTHYIYQGRFRQGQGNCLILTPHKFDLYVMFSH